jgi:phosphonate degradation associated HDIG domain protein
MKRLSSLDEIERLYAERGSLGYGEGVTQTEHAVQCAALAEAAGSPPSLIVAALLHDIGHLFEDEAAVAQARFDDRHEIAGAVALKALFGQAVAAPIALHVAAKRYLCFKDADYALGLSPASQRSLALQGGPFDATRAAAFEARPHWRDAVALRRFDDTGKCDDACGRSFADFTPLMRDLVIERAGS